MVVSPLITLSSWRPYRGVSTKLRFGEDINAKNKVMLDQLLKLIPPNAAGFETVEIDVAQGATISAGMTFVKCPDQESVLLLYHEARRGEGSIDIGSQGFKYDLYGKLLNDHPAEFNRGTLIAWQGLPYIHQFVSRLKPMHVAKSLMPDEATDRFHRFEEYRTSRRRVWERPPLPNPYGWTSKHG